MKCLSRHTQLRMTFVPSERQGGSTNIHTKSTSSSFNRDHSCPSPAHRRHSEKHKARRETDTSLRSLVTKGKKKITRRGGGPRQQQSVDGERRGEVKTANPGRMGLKRWLPKCLCWSCRGLQRGYLLVTPSLCLNHTY